MLTHYIIDHAVLVDPRTGEIKEVKLTKEQQIRMWNSVCPPVAEALVRANQPDMRALFPCEVCEVKELTVA